jgi:electron transfer flavoprotein-quinone oxidoreductase
MADDFDAIVVGAGMAGCAAAIRLAKAGLQVLLVERGAEPGAKNLSGGILWGRDLDRILPDWQAEMPLERHIVRKRFGFLSADRAVSAVYEDPAWGRPPYLAHSVLRARTDAWLAKKAEEAGATVVTQVPVSALAWQDGRVTGVRQEGETLSAPVTLLCDGANSRLSLGTPIRPSDHLSGPATELGIKEVYRLPSDVIESRFQLGPGEGHAEEWVLGNLAPGVMGGGFVYTNRDTLSLGVIVNLASLFGAGVRSFDLIERFKLHPAIARALRGAELVEYGAKLISSGWASRPQSFHGNGWLIAGDAAGFVFSNGIVIQGMNYAIRTGLEAAETVIGAKAAHDPSAARLAEYERRLEAAGVLADFRDFEGLDRVKWNPRFYQEYPELLARLFGRLMAESGRPKEPARDALKAVLDESGLSRWTLLKDGWSAYRNL